MPAKRGRAKKFPAADTAPTTGESPAPPVPQEDAGGETRAGCVRRDMTFPPFYDKLITERSESRGISRSEAMRQIIEEAQGTSLRHVRHELKHHLNVIKLEAATIRLTIRNPEHVASLSRVDAAIEAAVRLINEVTSA